MSVYKTFQDRPGGPWHPTASVLATDPRSGEVSEHLAGCLRCRAHEIRLAAQVHQLTSEPAVAALLSDSPVLPSGVIAAALDGPPDSAPAPITGELWRARDRADTSPGSTAVLVWVRRVLESTALVLPVVLDIEMADDQTLLLGPADSLLEMDAAVLTSVDAEILTTNLTNRVGILDIADDVIAVRDVARGKSASLPEGVRTGPRIVRDDDQRFDFRQAVGELLTAMGSLPEDEPDTPQERHDALALLEELRDLGYYEQGLRVEPAGPTRPLFIDGQRVCSPVATVHHLSTCVVVALLTGHEPSDALTGPGVADACRSFLSAYPEADSVAVCSGATNWPAVLLGPTDVGPAIGVPSGTPAAAGAQSFPLDLITALRKHFDGARDRWDDAVPVRFDDTSAGLGHARSVGAAQAQQAIEGILKEGARAHIPSKRAGYGAMDHDTIAGVQALIDAALAGDDAAAAVTRLLGDSR